MSFKKNKYTVLRAIINKEIADFAFAYFLNKRKVAKFLFEEKFISPFTEYWGRWNDPQVPNTYSHYSDLVMETLMLKCQPIMEKYTKLKLSPNYSYARIYKKGDVLYRHKDRFSCEISTDLEHWREEFRGENCAQAFLHYNKKGSKMAKANEFDTRPFLGLPAYFKKK